MTDASLFRRIYLHEHSRVRIDINTHRTLQIEELTTTTCMWQVYVKFYDFKMCCCDVMITLCKKEKRFLSFSFIVSYLISLGVIWIWSVFSKNLCLGFKKI